MEKKPGIRVIGNVSPEKKEQIKEEIEQTLFKHFDSLSPEEKQQLKKLEYPKSEKEIALINFANKETSQLMQQTGIEPYNVPIENFHIVPPELYKKAADDENTATTFNTKQGILFNALRLRNNPVRFGATALHELLHLKAHFSMEANEEENQINKTPYREGITVRALQSHGYHNRYHEHFSGLHEGIVAEIEKRLLNKLLDCPELSKEKEWLTSNEAKELKKKFSQKKEIPEDDIIWIDEKENDNYEVVSYSTQRNVFNYICSEIQQEFANQYQSADDVLKDFLKAHFTGQLLPIARLVEKTFGEGSFRLLGNMDTNRESGVLHFESLKKARAKQKK